MWPGAWAFSFRRQGERLFTFLKGGKEKEKEASVLVGPRLAAVNFAEAGSQAVGDWSGLAYLIVLAMYFFPRCLE